MSETTHYRFTKMQSLGNDFVMLDGVTEHIRLTRRIATRIADRHFGVGCDQIILAEKNPGDGDFVMRVFNPDGSEVGQCGNGARCLAIFLRDQGLWNYPTMSVDTSTARLGLEIRPDGAVTVDMGAPRFLPSEIPLVADREKTAYPLRLDQAELEFSAVSLGNPHCVLCVPDTTTAAVGRIGPVLESHPVFPQRANVSFREIISRSEIRLRVYERGTGETLGCGSAACAAVVTGIRGGMLDRQVLANLPGGTVVVNWEDDASSVRMTGSAETVFRGEYNVGPEIGLGA